MIFKAISLLGKASTVIWVAKTGYSAYKTGATAYKSYKNVKGVRSNATKIFTEVKRVMKK